jgi:hypothetical protein
MGLQSMSVLGMCQGSGCIKTRGGGIWTHDEKDMFFRRWSLSTVRLLANAGL